VTNDVETQNTINLTNTVYIVNGQVVDGNTQKNKIVNDLIKVNINDFKKKDGEIAGLIDSVSENFVK
jgi:hypothetical protein